MKTIKKYSFFSYIILFLFTTNYLSAKTKKESTIATFGENTISTNEFLYVYKKNNASKTPYDEKDIRTYLDLFINFKIKVKEAEKLKLDTAAQIHQEYEDFKKQLIKNYLIDKNLVDKMIEEAYSRLQTEINASHILITLPPNPEPKDTLEAYKKINSIRNQAIKGEDFSMLAKQYSQDPSAAYNKGNLGYFTALQMVYPFENAAYNTPVNEVSYPVRTRFGYHIIRVNNKRPSQGKVLVSHIMLRMDPNSSKEDSIKIKNKIDDIYLQLSKGSNWEKICQQYSEDVNTKDKAGQLEWFGVAEIIPSFEEAAFTLKTPGDISKPISTPYGWHIIRLIDKKPIESFDKIKLTIKNKVTRDSRFEINRAIYIEKLKKQYNFKEKSKNVALAIHQSDSSILKGSWKPKDENTIASKELFKIVKEKKNIHDFFTFITKNQVARENISPENAMRELYQEFVKKSVIEIEEKQLEETNEDYKNLLKEYKEGILYFQLMYDKVWSKAMNDTIKMRQFYEANKNLYPSNESAEVIIYTLADSNLIKIIKKSKKELGQLEKELNKKKPTNASIKVGKFEKGQNAYLNQIPWQIGNYTLKEGVKYIYIEIKNILPPNTKDFYEVKAQVASDLQKQEEEKFTKNLRDQYTVTVNDEEIKKIITH